MNKKSTGRLRRDLPMTKENLLGQLLYGGPGVVFEDIDETSGEESVGPLWVTVDRGSHNTLINTATKKKRKTTDF